MENEIKKTEETKEQGNVSNLSQLAEMVSRLEKANTEAKEILKKQEEFLVNKTKIEMLGGRTDAGIPQKEEKKETPQEYARRLMGRK